MTCADCKHEAEPFALYWMGKALCGACWDKRMAAVWALTGLPTEDELIHGDPNAPEPMGIQNTPKPATSAKRRRRLLR